MRVQCHLQLHRAGQLLYFSYTEQVSYFTSVTQSRLVTLLQSRQQKLLDAVFNPQIHSHRKCYSDIQQLSVSKGEVPSEQQERSSSLDQDQDQEEPEPSHIKEEQEELWTSQEGEQLQGLEEAELEFSSISVLVKGEEGDGRKAQTEENTEAERLETDSDGEDCEESEPPINLDPDSPLKPAPYEQTSSEPETEDSGDWEDTKEPESGLNSSENSEVPDLECNTVKTSDIASECAESFDHNGHLQKNNVIPKPRGKPLTCSVCGKTFAIRSSLTMHLKVCLYGKSFSCLICNQSFGSSSHLVRHMVIHSGEKPFSCSVCGKRFTLKQNLKRHLIVHTGEKPFSCSVCGARFSRKTHLKRHLYVHTAEKPFSCSVCGNSYARKTYLTRHLVAHTGENLLN
ncbi:zinc finger protein 135-like [Centropristis striata]|uniref:zinc finger protein 135-like n=1 Tax=Centropristis striata TaxID=184440 RepID=UPI0027E08F9B|nr:zinc finger protein 135-like [Centropristis striata]